MPRKFDRGEQHWHRHSVDKPHVIGDGGWTNAETAWVASKIEGDWSLWNSLHERGWNISPEDLRDVAIEKFIGPNNNEAIIDAQAWNSIPREERYDPAWEEMVETLWNPLMQTDPVDHYADREPDVIDPEMVNWQEIIDHWKPVDAAEQETTFPPDWNA